MICATCVHGKWAGFKILCSLLGELLDPNEAACDEYRSQEEKTEKD